MSNTSRICSICNSSKTYITKQGYEDWRHWNGEFLCKNCAAKEYKKANPEKQKLNHLKHSPNRIKFQGKTIQLPNNPRKGICSNCKRTVSSGEIKRTNLHHTKYDPLNPTAHTIELCIRCHMKEHEKILESSRSFSLLPASTLEVTA